jgi:hypothetical protein
VPQGGVSHQPGRARDDDFLVLHLPDSGARLFRRYLAEDGQARQTRRLHHRNFVRLQDRQPLRG